MKIKEDFVSGSDHDDWENEYYARKGSRGILGCIFLFGFFVLCLVCLLIMVIVDLL